MQVKTLIPKGQNKRGKKVRVKSPVIILGKKRKREVCANMRG